MPTRSATKRSNEVTFIGIDPGKQGGIAAIRPNGEISWWLMPSGDLELLTVLQKEIDTGGTVVAGIEYVHSMPGEGHKGAFTFGTNVGQLSMAIAASGFKKVEVPPRTWQAFFKIKPRGKQSKPAFKNGIRLLAHSTFPKLDLWTIPRTKGKQLAICDALFIAEYVRLTHK